MAKTGPAALLLAIGMCLLCTSAPPRAPQLVGSVRKKHRLSAVHPPRIENIPEFPFTQPNLQCRYPLEARRSASWSTSSRVFAFLSSGWCGHLLPICSQPLTLNVTLPPHAQRPLVLGTSNRINAINTARQTPRMNDNAGRPLRCCPALAGSRRETMLFGKIRLSARSTCTHLDHDIHTQRRRRSVRLVWVYPTLMTAALNTLQRNAEKICCAEESRNDQNNSCFSMDSLGHTAPTPG